MVKTLHFHCGESRLDPGGGTKIQQTGQCDPPQKKAKTKTKTNQQIENSEVSKMSIQMQNPVFIKILIFCSSRIFVCVDFDFLIT